MSIPKRTASLLFPLIIFACRGTSASQAQPNPKPVDPQLLSQLHDLAHRVLKDAGKIGCKPQHCRVLVSNFSLKSGETSALGMQLADDVSQDLTSSQHDFEIIDRSALQSYLSSMRIPSMLLQEEKAVRWLGKRFNANCVLVGKIEPSKDLIKLTFRLIGAKKARNGAAEDVRLSAKLADEDLKPSEPFPPKLPQMASSSKETQEMSPAGTHGFSKPQCVYCPDPQYTSEGKDARFQGMVVFYVTVSRDGYAETITAVRGVPYGLTEMAMETIRKWRFKPPTHEGVPTAVRVVIEVTLHPH